MIGRDMIPADRLAAILAYNTRRAADKTAAEKLAALLTRYGAADADGLTDKITALTQKASDMDGIAALVGGISNTAYKLLPSGLRAIFDRYRG